VRYRWKQGDEIRLRGLGVKAEDAELQQVALAPGQAGQGDRPEMVTVNRAWAESVFKRMEELSGELETLRARLMLWRTSCLILAVAMGWMLWNR